MPRFKMCRVIRLLTAGMLLAVPHACAATGWLLWENGRARSHIIPPATDPESARLATSTLHRHLRAFFHVELPLARDAVRGGTWLVLGTPLNNPVLSRLVGEGLELTDQDLGDEGFQLLTHTRGRSQFIILHARTARALKHACQELLFYRLAATTNAGWIESPLNVVLKPQTPYRGIYMLPCWSAYDSLESWERVLLFNSELTLNRNWFWLDGFPVAGHPGEYTNSPLANEANVQRLLNLAAAEHMKIYIGGGWLNWHHEKAIGKDVEKAVAYYLDYLRAFTNFHGFYFEPTGEGREIQNWRPEAEALRRMIREIHARRPDFEIALAIGKFNNPEYLQLMSHFDPQRVFWWWCWGNPLRDEARRLYPSVLRWHLSQRMSNFHGDVAPPGPHERALAGFVTSYDPGQGFGNLWNGWAKLGVSHPRNFHPHTIPYFAQQYFFRERCWNFELTQAQFLARLQARLFDADAPPDAVQHYWCLCQMAFATAERKNPRVPTPEDLAAERDFIQSLRRRTWTPRMNDTLARMEEAVVGLASRPPAPPP
ncbi:MAG: hypothetical protein RMK20_02300 [Verrucomicrobiales bacterium]|nr:hypothetical protein [Verrucomicrobiales bacterium]